jgi:hypothetical protein
MISNLGLTNTRTHLTSILQGGVSWAKDERLLLLAEVRWENF